MSTRLAWLLASFLIATPCLAQSHLLTQMGTLTLAGNEIAGAQFHEDESYSRLVADIGLAPDELEDALESLRFQLWSQGARGTAQLCKFEGGDLLDVLQMAETNQNRYFSLLNGNRFLTKSRELMALVSGNNSFSAHLERPYGRLYLVVKDNQIAEGVISYDGYTYTLKPADILGTDVYVLFVVPFDSELPDHPPGLEDIPSMPKKKLGQN